MLHEEFADIVDAIVTASRAVYGGRLDGVVVFGSVGRDRMRPDSDVDLLLVVNDLPVGRMARMDEFDSVEQAVAARLAEARTRGVTTWLSPIVRSLSELDRSGFLLFDIACDGRVVFDRDGAVAEYLADVRERLAARGTTRRSAGGRRYWVLEPGITAGDVVTL